MSLSGRLRKWKLGFTFLLYPWLIAVCATRDMHPSPAADYHC